MLLYYSRNKKKCAIHNKQELKLTFKVYTIQIHMHYVYCIPSRIE